MSDLDREEFTEYIADKKVIVIGEMHGTNEVPLFVLQLVQELKKQEKRLTVALEIPITYQSNIEEYLSTGKLDDLLKLDHFRYPDGRSSVAMGELLKGLRKLPDVNVLCFDSETGLDVTVDRDSLMGVNLIKSYHGQKMVVLTGNLHANLQEGYWQPHFKSAIFYLNRAIDSDGKIVSLNTYFGSGTIWNCMDDGCKERNFGAIEGLRKYGERYMVFFENTRNGYSGLIYFDKVTASKPLAN